MILPKVGSSLSSARATSISPNLDPVLRGANLDFIVNQVWISAWNKFVFNCEANLDFIGNQVFVFTLFKILLNIVNVSKRNPVCFLEARENLVFGSVSLYIKPISSQQCSQSRKAGFAKKIFQISVPMSVRFLWDFCQNLLPMEFWNFFRKENGKNSSSCMWLLPKLGAHNTCPLCYIWSRV